ncbi:NifU family protein [Janibacter sp. GXQ6167]|uniref:NifU family protein n=1 Tax=Janibacter sp. GXQ6167 TaxID=3240791 RepID=UPI0035247FF6
MHAETVLTDSAALRWVVSERLPAGRLLDAPGDLGVLLREGVIADATLEPYAVVVRAGAGTSWSHVGERVRRALAFALGDLSTWEVEADPDGVLTQIVREVLAGPVGDLARSHGGDIEVITVSDGAVTVELKGACHGCSAAGETLHERLESAIRARYPDLREVRDRSPQPVGRGIWPRLRAGLRADAGPGSRARSS